MAEGSHSEPAKGKAKESHKTGQTVLALEPALALAFEFEFEPALALAFALAFEIEFELDLALAFEFEFEFEPACMFFAFRVANL